MVSSITSGGTVSFRRPFSSSRDLAIHALQSLPTNRAPDCLRAHTNALDEHLISDSVATTARTRRESLLQLKAATAQLLVGFSKRVADQMKLGQDSVIVDLGHNHPTNEKRLPNNSMAVNHFTVIRQV